MLTKKQSKHPQIVFQVFQVFRVFQVFHFAFGPQNSPILVQIRTKPTNRRNHPNAISCLRKTPKKAIHPLVYERDTVLFVIAAVFFRRSGFFSSGEAAKRGLNPPSPMALSDGMGANYCTPAVRLQYSGNLWVCTHYMPKHVPTYGRALCVGVF